MLTVGDELVMSAWLASCATVVIASGAGLTVSGSQADGHALAPAFGQRDTARSVTRVSAVATTRMLWEQVTRYIAQSADDMSEAQYAYRPTPEVRTFGQLIGHLAGAQNSFCASARSMFAPAKARA